MGGRLGTHLLISSWFSAVAFLTSLISSSTWELGKKEAGFGMLQLLMLGQTAALGRHHITEVAIEVLFTLVRGAHVLLQPARRGGHERALTARYRPLAVVHLQTHRKLFDFAHKTSITNQALLIFVFIFSCL